MSFNHLNLHPKILKVVTELGYFEATKIQLQAIPKILEGFDVRASAQTGTGKTAAFLLPALHRLTFSVSKVGKGPRILILVPTRELAMQVTEQTEKYSKYLQCVKAICIVGGVPYPSQIRNLLRPYEILVATPGRLIDHLDQGRINFSRLEMLVLDEADRMLDMGFAESVEQIIAKTPSSRQIALFSATLQGNVIELSQRLLKKPIEIVAHAERERHGNIEQKLHYVDDLNHKNRLLDHILHQSDVDYAIVFTSTKRQADQLVENLRHNEHRAAALHGNMNQRQRTRTIAQFKNGQIKILVATDIAARGINVLRITHVINFDLPRNGKEYVHRIGRTGRVKAIGKALSFGTVRDALLIKKIESFTGQQIEIEEIAGFEPRKKQYPVNSKQHPRSYRNAKKDWFKTRAKPLKSSLSRRRNINY